MMVPKRTDCHGEAMRVSILSVDCLSDQFKKARPTHPTKILSREERIPIDFLISDSRSTTIPHEAVCIYPVPIKAIISSIERSTDISDPVLIPEKRNALS